MEGRRKLIRDIFFSISAGGVIGCFAASQLIAKFSFWIMMAGVPLVPMVAFPVAAFFCRKRKWFPSVPVWASALIFFIGWPVGCYVPLSTQSEPYYQASKEFPVPSGFERLNEHVSSGLGDESAGFSFRLAGSTENWRTIKSFYEAQLPGLGWTTDDKRKDPNEVRFVKGQSWIEIDFRSEEEPPAVRVWCKM